MAAIVRKIENSARERNVIASKQTLSALIEQQRHRWPASASTLAFMLIAPGPGKRQRGNRLRFDCVDLG